MKILITGGAGFLGKAIIQQLLQRGETVRTYSRGHYPELIEMGVETFQGDLNDSQTLNKAVESCDAVIHVAAKAGIWGSYKSYYKSNVLGTKAVIQACLKTGVKRLVYTSSPSVVFGGENLSGVNESIPYPSSFLAAYPSTKAEAEQIVLKANSEQLQTVALRPHLIWGPGDRHLVPKLIARAKAAKLRFIGKDNPLVDTVYIDNAAEAHLNALDRLTPGSRICGKSYFISQGEPIGIKDWVNSLLLAAKVPPVQKSIPYSVAYGAAYFFETLYKGLRIEKDPPLTRFLVQQLAKEHWFDISAAREELGYQPKVSIEEGMRRLSATLSKQ
ncbi:MAG: 3-beta hydroxysteroid dehydrogenase [Waddliaceae bacterium]|nr:3-beta hydroxysteroid dehydrogenase [Waddliaceae bacterium]